jgi:predicted RNase H-like HicB family nuclease
MERLFHLHIERLPEGVFLATSEEIQGLVAQGRTINETVEIARDVARKLIEAQAPGSAGSEPGDSFDFPILVPLEA